MNKNPAHLHIFFLISICSFLWYPSFFTQSISKQCIKQTIWKINQPSKPVFVEKAKKIIKKLEKATLYYQFRLKKRLSKIAVHALEYLRSVKLTNLKPSQKNALQPYQLINLKSQPDIQFLCTKGNTVIWYATFPISDGYGFILIGNEKDVIDSVIVPPDFVLTEYSCNFINNKFNDYAIELRNTKTSFRIVITSKKIYRFARIEQNFIRTKHVVVYLDSKNKAHAIVDNKKIDSDTKYISVIFSKDEKKVGCVVEKLTNNGTKSVLIVNGKKIGEYDRIDYYGFDHYSNKLKLVALQGRKWLAIVDGNVIAEYGVMEGHIEYISLSPDGKRTAITVKKDHNYILVVDGKEIAQYNEIYIPEFSPDSQKVAFLAKKDKKDVAVVDGKEIGEYDDAWEVYFSPDGKRYGFKAQKNGKWFVVIDGQESKKYDEITYAPYIEFSSDSRKTRFIAKKGNKFVVVVDKKESKEYDEIRRFTFSPDGRKFAFLGKENYKWTVVIDNNETQQYDAVINNKLQFTKNSKFLVFAIKDYKAATDCLIFNKDRVLCAKLPSPSPIFSYDPSPFIIEENVVTTIGFNNNEFFLFKCSLN
jgi:hypothetical protein